MIRNVQTQISVNRPLALSVLMAAFMSLLGCETSAERPPDATISADADAELQQVIQAITVSSSDTPVNNPIVIVRFDDQDCPDSVAFAATITDANGNSAVAVLPTGVPISSGTSVRWWGYDVDGNQFTKPYALFFHPFRREPFISNANGRIGPEPLRIPSRLPEGADYKYSVVKLNVTPWPLPPNTRPTTIDVDTSCDPLDPIIRILK